MSACCSGSCELSKAPTDRKYRCILWIALVVNVTMFIIEITAGWKAASAALMADSVDFFGDAVNYATTLVVLGMPVIWRSRTALAKGLVMGAYGFFVLGAAIWHFVDGGVPKAETMGVVGALAIVANGSMALLLYAYRNGDSNMEAVWLCTRNDVIGNLAVLLAAAGVLGTGSGWPDIIVAAVMGILGLTAARTVIGHARAELKTAAKPLLDSAASTVPR